MEMTPMKKRSVRVKNAEILFERCPQCCYEESICHTDVRDGLRCRFLTCPRGGCSEESRGEHVRRFTGYGVFVVKEARKVLKAGAFPEEITVEQIPALMQEFDNFASCSVLLTRWNSATAKLEILRNGAAGTSS
jgi:hypothetical protein